MDRDNQGAQATQTTNVDNVNVQSDKSPDPQLVLELATSNGQPFNAGS